MATISGIYGRVVWSAAYTSHVHAWQMDVVTDILEDTAWEFTTLAPGGAEGPSENRGWKTHIVGLSGFSGSFDCYQDSVPAEAGDGTSAIIYLYVDYDSLVCYRGVAIVSAIHPAAPIGGIQTVSIDFQGAAKLYEPTSTTHTTSTSTSTSTTTSTSTSTSTTTSTSTSTSTTTSTTTSTSTSTSTSTTP